MFSKNAFSRGVAGCTSVTSKRSSNEIGRVLSFLSDCCVEVSIGLVIATSPVFYLSPVALHNT